MRTTVDLPPVLHEQARGLAAERGQSLSAVLADLVARGLASLGQPAVIRRHPDTGVPVVSVGRPVTSQDVADALDDE